jgi:hypothetical protein
MNHNQRTAENLTIGKIKESLMNNLESQWEDFNSEWKEIVTSVYLDKSEKYELCTIIVNNILKLHKQHFEKIICLRSASSKPDEFEREYFAAKFEFIAMLLEVVNYQNSFYEYLESIKDFEQLFNELTKDFLDAVNKLTIKNDFETIKYITMKFSDNIHRLAVLHGVPDKELYFKLSKNMTYQKYRCLTFLDQFFVENK